MFLMKRYINAYIDKYPYKRLNTYIDKYTYECLLNAYIDTY